MTRRNLSLVGLALVAALAACSDRSEPVAPKPQAAWLSATTPAVPSPLNTVDLPGGGTLKLWPYTADSFPATHVDPINLVFVGPYSDPRQIRAALLGLGGDRSAAGLPPAFLPGVFDCHWQDGIGGGNQAAYVDGRAWQGSAIQLVCGPYDFFRFHLRLFRFGNITLGGAHFEMNIPGTPNHESLSWELARAVVAYDLMSSGRAQAVGIVNTGSQTPTYRTVNPLIYPAVANLLLALGAPTADIPNSGQATVLQLAQPPAAVPGSHTQTLTITMGIDLPAPFCNPGGFVHVAGPLQLSQTTTVTTDGDYASAFATKGTVTVTQLAPGGQTFDAKIAELDASALTNLFSQASLFNVQSMAPGGPNRGTQTTSFVIGPARLTAYSQRVTCY